jgi:hypothetical protein
MGGVVVNSAIALAYSLPRWDCFLWLFAFYTILINNKIKQN